jgi:NAD(P)-dependent dehydrogenase (short-subunit alcohol dehydrogenase family)
MSNGNQRIAVVIGGASGIGWATAQALAAQGDRVTVADRNADGAHTRASELGDPHTASSVDVTDEDSVQQLFEVENTALGRAGAPEDIANAVLYLCSPASSWLTGEVWTSTAART